MNGCSIVLSDWPFSLPRALVPTVQAKAETRSWGGLYLGQVAGSGRHRYPFCLLVIFLIITSDQSTLMRRGLVLAHSLMM